jgi:hypothetical protein
MASQDKLYDNGWSDEDLVIVNALADAVENKRGIAIAREDIFALDGTLIHRRGDEFRSAKALIEVAQQVAPFGFGVAYADTSLLFFGEG